MIKKQSPSTKRMTLLLLLKIILKEQGVLNMESKKDVSEEDRVGLGVATGRGRDEGSINTKYGRMPNEGWWRQGNVREGRRGSRNMLCRGMNSAVTD